MKYFMILLSAIVLEVCSTFYIRFVAENNALAMVLFASFSPFLLLIFSGTMVETQNWKQRIKLTSALSLGYGIGAFLVATLKLS